MTPRTKVLVTGANGFIGHALCTHFASMEMPFTGVVRAAATGNAPTGRLDNHLDHGSENIVALGDFAAADWSEVLHDVDAIVHLAGRAHVMTPADSSDPTPYVVANVHVTRRLLDAAVRAGVRRFVLASTVKVYGEASPAGRPFRPGDTAAPADAYAYSKMEAEGALWDACRTSSLEGVVLRLPLTYGAGVRGNFLALLEAIAAERRLPLGGIANRRSLLYVGNAVSAFTIALSAPAIVGQTLPVADAESVSTSVLAERIGRSLGVPVRFYRAPAALLRIGAALAGRRAAIERLLGTLEVDSAIFGGRTGWSQPFTLDQGLLATARGWRLRHAL